MRAVDGDEVRPTKRCLDDLGIIVPPIPQGLGSLDHEVRAKAAQVRDSALAGSAERIECMKDRVVLKVKIGQHRGALHELRARPSCSICDEDQLGVPEGVGRWWLLAAGSRRQDSHNDFYKQLCEETGKGSEGLLPCSWDWRRLSAELALSQRDETQRSIRRAAFESMTSAHPVALIGDLWSIQVQIRAEDGRAYMTVGGRGAFDQRLFPIIMASIPGIDPHAWKPVDGKDAVPGWIRRSTGEILWFAPLPPEAQALLMDEFEDLE